MATKTATGSLSAHPRRIVRHNTLPGIVGLSESTIRRLIAAGKFPAPFHLSNQAVGFDLVEVTDWIESRKANRQQVAA